MDIQRERGIIPACDVSPAAFESLLAATADMPHVTGYKVGATLGLTLGLPAVVTIARRYTTKLLIYDHQKGGTDIPDTATAFAAMLRDAGIDAAILFPLSGPSTERAWIEACHAAGLRVIVGAHMTHPQFLVSEGGYIADAAVEQMLVAAAACGVRDFVVPGTKPASIRFARSVLAAYGKVRLFTPGLITQGGTIAECREAAGDRWHAIVGRALFDAPDVRAAAAALAPFVQ